MKGYHYTTEENFKKIVVEGIKPRPLLLEGYEDQSGIYVWCKKLKGLDHTVAILYQILTNSCSRVVQLRVEFEQEDVLLEKGKPMMVKTVFSAVHFEQKSVEFSYVVLKRIPAGKITKLCTYDLMKAFS